VGDAVSLLDSGESEMADVKRFCRGSAVVEMAVMLPILLLILFGITEFGRAWMTVNIMNTAAREGARLAVVTAPEVPAVVARVTEVLGAAGITATSVTVSGPAPTDPSRRVCVSVAVNFTVIPGTVLGVFSGTIPLHASTTMRHEAY
jgi:Flp pilus assembly protein TadG